MSRERAVGIHVSISGKLDESVDRALGDGCVGTFQIFTCSPRRWEAPELDSSQVESFKTKASQNGYQVFAHMPYLPNLCSPDADCYSKSVKVLIREIRRCSTLGIGGLVLHFGSLMHTSREEGRRRFVDACTSAISETGSISVQLLLENSADKKSVGSTFEDIELVLKELNAQKRVGVCLDTCHAFASGYDLRGEEGVGKTVDLFDSTIGLGSLRLIHLNDSAFGLGEGRDRHEQIGRGKIGRSGISAILKFPRLLEIPAVLETPRFTEEDDKRNVRAARKLAADK